jgi:hypothetical protein
MAEAPSLEAKLMVLPSVGLRARHRFGVLHVLFHSAILLALWRRFRIARHLRRPIVLV